MLLENSYNRLKYGPLVERDWYEGGLEEYQELVESLDDVEVDVESYYDAVPGLGNFLTPGGQKPHKSVNETLEGDEAWDFAFDHLEEFADESVDDMTFYLEHRSKDDNHRIELRAAEGPLLGVGREYVLRFNGESI